MERERSGAAARLHEASERWEAQLQAMRMRLVAEHDIKVSRCVQCGRVGCTERRVRVVGRCVLLMTLQKCLPTGVSVAHTRCCCQTHACACCAVGGGGSCRP